MLDRAKHAESGFGALCSEGRWPSACTEYTALRRGLALVLWCSMHVAVCLAHLLACVRACARMLRVRHALSWCSTPSWPYES